MGSVPVDMAASTPYLHQLSSKRLEAWWRPPARQTCKAPCPGSTILNDDLLNLLF